METQTDKPRVQIDRDAWIAAATEVLAEEGITGLRVEVLAKRLKVTKGSFYWHLQDRRDLLIAVLLHWKEGRIRDIIKQTTADPGHELEQIYHVNKSKENSGPDQNRKNVPNPPAVKKEGEISPNLNKISLPIKRNRETVRPAKNCR